MTTLTGHSIIAGAPVAGRLPGSPGVEAATGEPLEPVYTYVDEEQLESATQAAADAFDTYRATSPEQRATFLERVAGHRHPEADLAGEFSRARHHADDGVR